MRKLIDIPNKISKFLFWWVQKWPEWGWLPLQYHQRSTCFAYPCMTNHPCYKTYRWAPPVILFTPIYSELIPVHWPRTPKSTVVSVQLTVIVISKFISILMYGGPRSCPTMKLWPVEVPVIVIHYCTETIGTHINLSWNYFWLYKI